MQQISSRPGDVVTVAEHFEAARINLKAMLIKRWDLSLSQASCSYLRRSAAEIYSATTLNWMGYYKLYH